MRIYLAGENQKAWVMDKILNTAEGDMKVYLAGVAPWRDGGMYDDALRTYKPYILESFYYVNSDTERLLPYFSEFILDSGAFTFMADNKGSKPNWDEYIEKYTNFINRNKIDKYLELDIDNIVGYDKVKQMRATLERETGKPCIPVWHKERGADEFKGLTKDYSYIALGGLVRTDYDRLDEKVFTPLINTSHANGCKIHGLGYTRLEGLTKYHFDSVDSTAWTTGNRFGHIYRFNGKTMTKTDKPTGMRIGDAKKAALINFIEWIKFQRYADTHL